MVVKIRLARFGKRHAPLYNIVVAQARTARDSRPMEVLGTYDPTPRVPLASNDPPPLTQPASSPSDAPQLQTNTSPFKPTEQPELQESAQPQKPKRYKDISLDTTRTKYWLGVGAQPSEPVWRLLSLMGLIEPKPGTRTSPKAGTRKSA